MTTNMANGFWLIAKDLRGWRMEYANRRSEATWKLDDGRDISHQVYPATQASLAALVRGETPSKLKDEYMWPMDEETIVKFLEAHGYGVDSDLRVHPRLGPPYTKIKPGQIGPIIMIHMKSCEERGKNPESEPIALLWDDGPDGSGMLLQLFDIGKIVPVPCPVEEPGKLTMRGPVLCLSWHDYSLIPKGSNTLALHKFLDVTEGPESMEQLAKEEKFVNKDGVVCKRGLNAMKARTISIEDFLK